jgi:hypothetical protein
MTEEDFKQAIRLLHVWHAWAGIGRHIDHAARQDPLYPGLHLPMQEPLIKAAAELLAKYPYEPIAAPVEPQTQETALG